MDREKIEQRSNSVCFLHVGLEERMAGIDKKLGKIVDSQSDHRNDITRLANIIEDGLKSKLSETIEVTKNLDEKLDRISNRLIPIEDFNWFREWMTNLRNNLVKKTLALAIVGGITYMLICFGDRMAKKIIEMAIG